MAEGKNKLIYLRNQDKIKAVLGADKLKIIRESIQSFVDSGDEIESDLIDDDKFKTFMIDDVSNDKGLISFYIIESSFNIYKIAFREFIN